MREDRDFNSLGIGSRLGGGVSSCAIPTVHLHVMRAFKDEMKRAGRNVPSKRKRFYIEFGDIDPRYCILHNASVIRATMSLKRISRTIVAARFIRSPFKVRRRDLQTVAERARPIPFFVNLCS